MATPEGLNHCKATLLKQREVFEDEILEHGEVIKKIQRDDYSRDGDSQYQQELQKELALKNLAFANLKKVNVRIDNIDKRIFTGVCPDCGKERDDEDICEHPLRDLCIECQLEKNNHRK